MYNVFGDELLSREWCEQVFEGRNKEYGAYRLRRSAGKRYTLALYAVFTIGIVAFLVRLGVWALRYGAESGTFDGDMPGVALEKLKAEEGYEFRYIQTSRPPQPKIPEGENATVPVIVDTVVTSQTLGVEHEDAEGAAEADVPVLADIPTDTVRLIVERDDLPVDEEPSYIPITEVPEMPQFPGGEKELMRFLDAEIAYTDRHIKAHIEGEAEVAFIVDKTGAVRDARLLHKIQPELDASILRAVERLPQWKPGRVGGRPVNVRIRIPIHFKAK
ncbi:MAG: TonB family protein [Alloprevotella sp.]|nr:TonB family protein [Alloprevotella sp.]MBR1652414.1 TonB family protein [Alloprevotella sp.]